MLRIADTNVTAWTSVQDSKGIYLVPKAIAAPCPQCFLKHGFRLNSFVNPAELVVKGYPFQTSRPSCETEIRFYILNPGASVEDWSGEIWMSPAAPARSDAAWDSLTGLSPRLGMDYKSLLGCYEHGLWRPTAQGARTLLEGIVKTLLPEDVQTDKNGHPLPLAKLFEMLAQEQDLAQPIKGVGEVLREGGNLASHFDAKRDIDQNLATEIFDLLDALIDYLLIIPERVARLKRLIAEAP